MILTTLKVIAFLMVWFLIPVVAYCISDYFAGYFSDRISDINSIIFYCNSNSHSDLLFFHVAWPVFVPLLICLWLYEFVKLGVRGYKIGINLTYFSKAGKERRKKELDLDYQVEKYLLEKNEE